MLMERRQKRNLTQENVAEITQTTARTVRNWESGKVPKLTPTGWIQLQRIYGLTLEEFAVVFEGETIEIHPELMTDEQQQI